MPVIIHQITAVLNMPDEYLEQIDRSQKIIAACTGNPYVTVPVATLTAAGTALTDFKSAPVSSRTSALRTLRNALKAIMSLFQVAADAAPANAETIILSGNFKVKIIALNQKQTFVVENGINPGMIHLEGEAGPPHTCHDWNYSPDGINFTRMPPTVAAHTDKIGLTPGQYAYFTHELVTKDGGQGVSQIEKIMVK
jgi:hypothetical protein